MLGTPRGSNQIAVPKRLRAPGEVERVNFHAIMRSIV